MVKTSTSQHPVNLSNNAPTEMELEQTIPQDELFYKSIKPQLDQLVMNPSDETIEKILAYSKK